MLNLKKLRMEARLTTTELSKILGCSNPTITHYEHGDREPDHQTLSHIADYFNVSVDYLLGRTDSTGWSQSEKAQGISDTISIPLTIDEYELVLDFRELGNKKGQDIQELAHKIITELNK